MTIATHLTIIIALMSMAGFAYVLAFEIGEQP